MQISSALAPILSRQNFHLPPSRIGSGQRPSVLRRQEFETLKRPAFRHPGKKHHASPAAVELTSPVVSPVPETPLEIGFAVGQIWQSSDPRDGRRQIRLLSREEDGRWLTRTIVDALGAPVTSGRRTRISEATLRTSYVRAPE